MALARDIVLEDIASIKNIGTGRQKYFLYLTKWQAGRQAVVNSKHLLIKHIIDNHYAKPVNS